VMKSEMANFANLDPRNVKDGWLDDCDVDQLDSLATLFARAAFSAQQTLVVRLKSAEAKSREELIAERKVAETREVARKERELCKICFDAPSNCAFNCGHLICCMACGQQCPNCPSCRVLVQSRMHVYT